MNRNMGDGDDGNVQSDSTQEQGLSHRDQAGPADGRPMNRRRFLMGASAGLAAVAATGMGSALAQQHSKTAPITQGTGRLRGKTAVITGGARGIGRAIAEAFAKEGADIMVIDIAGPVSPASEAKPASREDLAETGRLVRQYGRRFIPIVADVRDLPALREAARRAEHELGHIDIVVADAGIQTFAPLLTMNDRQWHDIIDVNLTGYANTIRAFAPHMVPRQYGRIIMIASSQGRHGTKNGSSYSASKWGVIGLMKSAALEFGEHKITVNCIEPGLVETALTVNPTRFRAAIMEDEHIKNPPANPSRERVMQDQIKHSPMHIPWLQPSDIAPVAVFLASDEAHLVSGATYDCNAGGSANYSA